MTSHKIGTREQWAAAREQLLAREKEHTRLGDELARQRRELPWVRSENAADTDPAALIEMLVGPIHLRRFIQGRPMTATEIDDLATRVVAAFSPPLSPAPTAPEEDSRRSR
jgi:hypothetical protein